MQVPPPDVPQRGDEIVRVTLEEAVGTGNVRCREGGT
jgi:hypothetical protein